MDFSYYLSFFHDGSLLSITYLDDQIDFEMCSAGLIQSENRDQIALDDEGRVHGTLSVRGIRNVIVNNELFYENLRMKRDETELLDFELGSGRVELGVLWNESFPADFLDFSYIVIACASVSWKDALNDVELDISDLLKWPLDYMLAPFSLPYLCSREGKIDPKHTLVSQSASSRSSLCINWPPGRDCIEAIQHGWKLVSGNAQNAAHFQAVKNLATGDIWRFDRAKYGSAGPRGIDHWHHINTNQAVPEEYLDLAGKPCPRKREASRIYYRTGNSQQLPPEGNPVLSFIYYMGFFHDGTATAIRHIGESLEIALSSSQILSQYSRDVVALNDEGCLEGNLAAKGVRSVRVNGTRVDKLVMKSSKAELLHFGVGEGYVELNILWMGSTSKGQGAFSEIVIWCERAFWEPSHGGVILDISQLLKR